MSEVFVAVGSNQNAPAQIRAALNYLRTRFGDLRVSPAYESADAAGGAAPYVNLVVSFKTIVPLGELVRELRNIEQICGRDRAKDTAGVCPLDLDLLLLGSAVIDDGPLKVPHPELAKRPYMLRPLADLEGGMSHPTLGLSFEDLWDKLGGVHSTLRRFPYPLG